MKDRSTDSQKLLDSPPPAGGHWLAMLDLTSYRAGAPFCCIFQGRTARSPQQLRTLLMKRGDDCARQFVQAIDERHGWRSKEVSLDASLRALQSAFDLWSVAWRTSREIIA